MAGNNMALTGKTVNILAAENQSTQTHTVEQKTSGLTLALSGMVGSAINTAVSSANRGQHREQWPSRRAERAAVGIIGRTGVSGIADADCGFQSGEHDRSTSLGVASPRNPLSDKRRTPAAAAA